MGMLDTAGWGGFAQGLNQGLNPMVQAMLNKPQLQMEREKLIEQKKMWAAQMADYTAQAEQRKQLTAKATLDAANEAILKQKLTELYGRTEPVTGMMGDTNVLSDGTPPVTDVSGAPYTGAGGQFQVDPSFLNMPRTTGQVRSVTPSLQDLYRTTAPYASSKELMTLIG